LVKRPVTPQVKAVPVKMPFVAPTIIPDVIPEVTNEIYTEVPEIPAAEEAGEEGGTEGGIEGGELGGEIGGVIGGLPTAPAPEIIEVKRDAPLPVGAISQEYPQYPEFALKRNWEDVLVVRYTIGKDGRVKEVSILQPPEREEFARETLSKIRHWRFHPYRDESGEPKEVVHELTVEFKIYRRGKT
jgi:protein TonB